MTAAARLVVLVSEDDALASTLRAALEACSPPVRVETTPASTWRATLAATPVDCVVWADAPSSTIDSDRATPSPVDDIREMATDCPVILSPSTPVSAFARAAADGDAVRYVPGAIDTDDRALLVDAVDDALDEHVDELEAERDLLARTSSLADVGGWELDADREELRWTSETYQLHGVSESYDPTLEGAIEFYHFDDRESVRADVEGALAGEPFDETYRFHQADGELRWVRSRGVPIVEDGEVVGVSGAFQDVTERKRSQENVRRFKRAVEAAGHAIFITAQDGTIEYVNPAFEEITGYDAAEAIGRDPSILKSGEMDQEYYTRLWNTILSGAVWSEPIVNARKSGEHYHASETIAPIVDDGDIEGFVAIQTDVTEQVHTKERLETFREIVHRLGDPIMFQDRDGDFEIVNDAVATYAGLSKSELTGEDEFAFMDDHSARLIQERKARVIEADRAITYEIEPTFPTKGERSFVTTRYPHYGEDGEVDGTVAICRDVTERAEREHHLRVLDRILRHNLYNKMNLIQGHAELLEAGTSGKLQDSAQQIRQTGDELVGLADKERRVVELLTNQSEPRRLDVRPLLETVVLDLRDAYPDYPITLECSTAHEVRAIPELRDAVAELIENAITHGGETPDVSVSVRRDGDRIVVSVADRGPGIPEMERESAGAVTDITPLFHGSGLGLQFVHHVARRSGGSLRFDTPETDDGDDDSIGTVAELYLPVPVESSDVESAPSDSEGAVLDSPATSDAEESAVGDRDSFTRE
ncbi:PAS domain S-box protein [Halobellus ordinarius]|uniref:PAS domain S-box protein n=1 Tax=Halobellus ordinarius TaxID=3075120 RepID=UPI0028802EF5|nr:PAS domain S-box protein [Halobellus sp. ZY16]